jgi:hypothetical protein
MNIVDPIVTGYVFSEIYNQVGEGIYSKEEEPVRLNFSAAYPIDSLAKDLPEGLKNKMVPIGLVKIDATMVIPSDHKLREQDADEMMPEDMFNRLIDNVSQPFPRELHKPSTRKLHKHISFSPSHSPSKKNKTNKTNKTTKK